MLRPWTSLLAAFELVQALGGVGLGALGDLAQQVHRGLQTRLGAREGGLGQPLHPGVGLLQGRGGVVVDLVGAQRVEAAQEARLRAGPVRQVLGGRAQEPRVLRILGVGGVELVVQRRHQLALGAGAPALLHEEPAQDREQQRRVRGAQHPPGGMPLAQRLDLRELHVGLLGVGGLSVAAGRAPRGQSRSGGRGAGGGAMAGGEPARSIGTARAARRHWRPRRRPQAQRLGYGDSLQLPAHHHPVPSSGLVARTVAFVQVRNLLNADRSSPTAAVFANTLVVPHGERR